MFKKWSNAEEKVKIEQAVVKVLSNYNTTRLFSYNTFNLPNLLSTFLEKNCNVNATTSNGMSIFIYMCMFARALKLEQFVQYFIDNKVNIDYRTSSNYTALMHTCFRSNTTSSDEIAKMLIRAGADLNIQDNVTGRTALQLACEHLATNDSTVHTVRYLIEHGASLEIQTLLGSTPLICLIKLSNANKDVDICKRLEEATEILLKSGSPDLNKISCAMMQNSQTRVSLMIKTKLNKVEAKQKCVHVQNIYLVNECPICFGVNPNIVLGDCGHMICEKCFENVTLLCLVCKTKTHKGDCGHMICENCVEHVTLLCSVCKKNNHNYYVIQFNNKE